MAKEGTQTPGVQLPATTLTAKWYVVLNDFLQMAGLYETIRGFEADLLVLSRAQHEQLPKALKKLAEDVELFLDYD